MRYFGGRHKNLEFLRLLNHVIIKSKQLCIHFEVTGYAKSRISSLALHPLLVKGDFRKKRSSSPTLTLAWLSTWWKSMEKEKLTDKEVYRNESAKKTFKKYFSTESVGHAVDTLQITKTHTNGSAIVYPVRIDPTVAECTGQGSLFGGRGKKIYEHREVTAQLRGEINLNLCCLYCKP